MSGRSLRRGAAEHGIEVREIRRTYADGSEYPTIKQVIENPDRMQVPIPVQLASGAPASRTCTVEWKAKALSKARRDMGASCSDPALVAIGFSIDEIERAGNKREAPDERIVYPLLELELTRQDCARIIADAGLPVPPKSSCWFCPWHSIEAWRDMKRDEPDLFAAAVELEAVCASKTRGGAVMTDYGSLRDIEGIQGSLFDGPQDCTSGACWT